MWQRLSIRTQLTLLMLALITLIEIATLGLVIWFDTKERQSLAIEQATTLGHSLNNDLLKVLLNANVDALSDISFRIEGFKSVDALQLENNDKQPIFAYGEQQYLSGKKSAPLLTEKPHFDPSGRLFIKLPVKTDGYTLGEVVIVINPEQYITRIKENFITLLWIFPIELLIGFFIAWRISLYYSKPFEVLVGAIQKNDIEGSHFIEVSTAYKNEIGLLFSGYNRMISKIINTTKILKYRSNHDSLTGLLNRYAIEQEIEKALQDEDAESHVLISLDLDQFKNINDSIGYIAGDELLQLVAHYCSNYLPKSTCIARVGGDDFFFLLKKTSKQQAVKVATKLLNELSDFRFAWKGESLSVSASMGLVAFKPFEYTLTELIKTTDVAFYAAKSKGQNKIHVHESNPKDVKPCLNEIKIASFIKEALKEGPARFELFAQDIVPLQKESNKISYEILIRLWDANNDMIFPDNFLPTAERYQLMVDIDIFVLTTYLTTICMHPQHVESLHSVHINLAGGTLNHPDFQACVRDSINKYDFPWDKLELEITETSSIGNLVQAQEFIEFCKQAGIGFALDDFGTGMSSFEYLKNLPFDVIKIDGSFVRDMLTDPFDHAMIRYTHEMSKLRNQETVAEYVETQADVDELRKIGITYGQGYFLGKPRPLASWLVSPEAEKENLMLKKAHR